MGNRRTTWLVKLSAAFCRMEFFTVVITSYVNTMISLKLKLGENIGEVDKIYEITPLFIERPLLF